MEIDEIHTTQRRRLSKIDWLVLLTSALCGLLAVVGIASAQAIGESISSERIDLEILNRCASRSSACQDNYGSIDLKKEVALVKQDGISFEVGWVIEDDCGLNTDIDIRTQAKRALLCAKTRGTYRKGVRHLFLLDPRIFRDKSRGNAKTWDAGPHIRIGNDVFLIPERNCDSRTLAKIKRYFK